MSNIITCLVFFNIYTLSMRSKCCDQM